MSGRKGASKWSPTAIRFDPETRERLQVAADEREVSVAFIVNRAVKDYLDRLIPIDELMYTRRAREETDHER